MKVAGLKSFIDSKTQLLSILKRDPVHEAQYEVTKYCKIPVGESKDSKQYIPLKPKQKLTIKWKYDSLCLEDTPEPIVVDFQFMSEDSTHNIFQSGDKLRKWLNTNAFEITKSNE